MNRVYQQILQNLINSNFQLPEQNSEFYDWLAHIAEALPNASGKIDLDSNLPSYQEGDANPVPDWRTSMFYTDPETGEEVANPLWNESVKQLWDAIKEYSKQPTGENGYDERTVDIYFEDKKDTDTPISSMSLDDIRYSDAGTNFISLLSNYDKYFGPWVKPWRNVDDQTYKEVRSVDYILKQILNYTYLQFTTYSSIDASTSRGRGIIHGQMRLLMPKNSRHVIIEDLNRNFWVLGNSIAGLCAYLFGSGSPLKDIYSRLTNELIQLWENVISLWLMAALSMLKPCTDIHVELFFVPNSVSEPYKKYDDFDSFQSIPASKRDIINNTVAYAKKYQNSNCIMFPMVRKNNYEKNYFDWIFIPFVIFIIREGNGEEKVIVQELRDTQNYWVQAHPVDYAQKLWCARETPLEYYYSYPLSEIPIKEDVSRMAHKFYSGFRPHLSFTEKGYEKGSLYLKGLEISFTDAIGESFAKDDLTTLSFRINKLTSSLGEGYTNQTIKEEVKSSQSSTDVLTARPTEVSYESFTSYYLGDFPSVYDVSVQGKQFKVVSENSLATQAMLIKIGQYLPKIYNTRTGIQTANIYSNPSYFQPQYNSSHQETSYELNYTPNNKSRYSGQGLPIDSCDFYVCNPNSYCFKRKVDLNENPSETNSAWTKLKDIGNEVISEFLDNKNIDKITYLMAAIGVRPWRNDDNKPNDWQKQGYWTNTILTHMYRFIPHKLIDFWDKYGKSKGTEVYEFNINGQKCYLECLGFVGKDETAFGGAANFKKIGTTWRLPELRSYYDDHYNDFLELQDVFDKEAKYYLDMAKYDSADPLRQKYEECKQSGDWTQFEDFLSNNYRDYKDDFLPAIEVGEDITTLAGLWSVYDGNVKMLESQPQPAELNHKYHNQIVYDDQGRTCRYREVGSLYFNFVNNAIVLPLIEKPVMINRIPYWAYYRALNEQNSKRVDGTYIMIENNDIIQQYTINF